MRNFILFIRRFSNLILFLLLEVFCIVLIARTNTMQGNDVMSSANVLLAGMYQRKDNMVYYFGLKEMNDSLISENKYLRKQLALYNSVDTFVDSNVQQTIYEPDTNIVKQYANYVYRSAKVINNSIASVNNYITINRGEKDGIKKNMAVISGNGAVGKIVHTSANFSSAISILSKKQKVSAKLKDGTVGYVIWNTTNPQELQMKDIPQQIKVSVGDSVFTTEYSFFPANVLVGVVTKKDLIESTKLQLLYLKPVTNFRNLKYVYIVENTMSEEQQKLEAANQE